MCSALVSTFRPKLEAFLRNEFRLGQVPDDVFSFVERFCVKEVEACADLKHAASVKREEERKQQKQEKEKEDQKKKSKDKPSKNKAADSKKDVQDKPNDFEDNISAKDEL